MIRFPDLSRIEGNKINVRVYVLSFFGTVLGVYGSEADACKAWMKYQRFVKCEGSPKVNIAIMDAEATNELEQIHYY